jgi:hypothetical protein
VWDYYIITLVTELVYFALLIHIARNGGNRWLVMNCALIVLSALGIAGVGYAYVQVYWHHNTTYTIDVINAVAVVLEEGFPAIVHNILAMKYRTIARSVPAMLEEREEETDSDCKKAWFKAL